MKEIDKILANMQDITKRTYNNLRAKMYVANLNDSASKKGNASANVYLARQQLAQAGRNKTR